MVQRVREYFIEPELRPEFIEEVKATEKEKGVPFNSIDELDSLVENA